MKPLDDVGAEEIRQEDLRSKREGGRRNPFHRAGQSRRQVVLELDSMAAGPPRRVDGIRNRPRRAGQEWAPTTPNQLPRMRCIPDHLDARANYPLTSMGGFYAHGTVGDV